MSIFWISKLTTKATFFQKNNLTIKIDILDEALIIVMIIQEYPRTNGSTHTHKQIVELFYCAKIKVFSLRTALFQSSNCTFLTLFLHNYALYFIKTCNRCPTWKVFWNLLKSWILCCWLTPVCFENEYV